MAAKLIKESHRVQIFETWQLNERWRFCKDTDSLDRFNGQVEGYGAHPSALSVLVLQDVSPQHCASHGEHLFQLLPAHLVVKLNKYISAVLRLTSVSRLIANILTFSSGMHQNENCWPKPNNTILKNKKKLNAGLDYFRHVAKLVEVRDLWLLPSNVPIAWKCLLAGN